MASYGLTVSAERLRVRVNSHGLYVDDNDDENWAVELRGKGLEFSV